MSPSTAAPSNASSFVSSSFASQGGSFSGMGGITSGAVASSPSLPSSSDLSTLRSRYLQSNQEHVMRHHDRLSPPDQLLLYHHLNSVDIEQAYYIYNAAMEAHSSLSTTRTAATSSSASLDTTTSIVDQQATSCLPPCLVQWSSPTEFKLSPAAPPSSPGSALSSSSSVPVASLTKLTEVPQSVREAWRGEGLRNIGLFGAVLLAGGQGSRLGFDGPKGCYPIGPLSKKSLFQIICERITTLKELAKQAILRTGGEDSVNISVPLYIMTSEDNRQETEAYFYSNNFFHLPPSDVVFFNQKMIPCFDNNGKLLFSSKTSLCKNPNGNGGVFEALRDNGILADIQKRGIVGLHVFGVDNVLCKPLDPLFMGYCFRTKVDIGNKCVERTNPKEAVGVFCQKVGGPEGDVRATVVEYSELPEKLRYAKAGKGESAECTPPVSTSLSAPNSHMPNGHYDAVIEKTNGTLSGIANFPDMPLLFSAANIANHFFTVKFVEGLLEGNMLNSMYHIAHKKVPYMDVTRDVEVRPSEPNGIKLELFIFDSFSLAKTVGGVEVERAEEFAPVKNNGNGEDSVGSAIRRMCELHTKWLEQNGKRRIVHPPAESLANAAVSSRLEGEEGGVFAMSDRVEISGLVSYEGENLDQLFTDSGGASLPLYTPYRLDCVAR